MSATPLDSATRDASQLTTLIAGLVSLRYDLTRAHPDAAPSTTESTVIDRLNAILETTIAAPIPGPMFEQPLLGLELQPTIAMCAGSQLIFQCAQCGLLAVQTELAPGHLGSCPACNHTTWWKQTLPVAGLHAPDAS